MNNDEGIEMYYLGIDIGGTHTKAVVLDAQGEVIEQRKLETEDSALNPEIWKSKIFGLIQSKTDELANGDSSKLRCGISAPDWQMGEIRKSSICRSG
ncbi:FGGY family carbohydrate kinase [Algoriphagus halophilus]|uniref:FGGY family carbohydrate kinase n=1 Tax=Algoriphagus halophilus TaxID=226505 RepID=UPI00358E22CF